MQRGTIRLPAHHWEPLPPPALPHLVTEAQISASTNNTLFIIGNLYIMNKKQDEIRRRKHEVKIDILKKKQIHLVMKLSEEMCY